MPCTFIKGQVLTDLVAKFTEPHIKELPSVKNMDEKLVGKISQYRLPTWEVYVDGASNQKGSGIGLVLMSPEKVIIEKSLRLDFSAHVDSLTMLATSSAQDLPRVILVEDLYKPTETRREVT